MTRADIAGKLPKITLGFWIMKICATTLGETAGDLFSKTLAIGYALSSVMLLAIFGMVLATQLSVRKFHPVLYWTVILATSTAGTTMSDYMDRTLGLGYMAGSAILLGLLVTIFAVWYGLERSLSVVNIRTRRAEVLYWSAILISNTLGTALGDFLADDSGLGFMGGAVLIGSLIVLTALLMLVPKIPRVALFWVAFVLTRPFGATFGDVLTRPRSEGGVNFGTWGSSGVLLGILVVGMIATMVRMRRTGVGAVRVPVEVGAVRRD